MLSARPKRSNPLAAAFPHMRPKILVILTLLATSIILAAISCRPLAKPSGPAPELSSAKPGSPATASSRNYITGERPVATLAAIPDSAEIIASAQWAGNKASDGSVSNELYVMDSNGGNITRITYNGYNYNHFAVAPNRKMIAAVRFAVNTNGTFNEFNRKTLWILDLENSKEWPLVPELDAGWGGVDWSPDSRNVYFSVFRNSISDIYRIGYDGEGLTNLTENLDLPLPWPSVAEKARKWVSDVGVSPDGEWIAFHYTRQGAQKGVIGICRIDGTNGRIVTDGGPMKPGKYGPYTSGDFDPEFSPDGSHIVFARTTGVATNWLGVTSHDVMTVKTDGAELKDLSPAGNAGTSGIPDWSEDNRIVFTDWNKQQMYVGPVTVNADGSNYKRLEKANGAAWARWIPRLSR
jgi:Tol biopolymer transport system component